MALATPLGSVCDGDAAHTLPSATASSTGSFASWPQCLMLLGPWQAALGLGSPKTPEKVVGRAWTPELAPPAGKPPFPPV